MSVTFSNGIPATSPPTNAPIAKLNTTCMRDSDNANMTITAITTALGVPIMLNNIFHSSLPNDLTMRQAVSDGLIVNIFKY